MPANGLPIIARPAAARRANRRTALRRAAARRSTLAVTAVAASALVVGAVAAPANAVNAAFDPNDCVPDYSPPAITAFTFSPGKVNVKKGSKNLSVTARATDTQGVASMTAIFESPKKKGDKQHFAAAALRRTGGTSTNGTFTGKAKVNRWVVPGAWKVSAVMATDTKGAVSFLDYNALGVKKWKRDLKVVSKPDLKAPKLTGFSLSPTKVSSVSKPAKVKVTAKAKDTQSGVSFVTVTLTKDGGRDSVQGTLKRVKGSPKNGTFSGSLTIPRWVGKAKWSAAAQVMDQVGNNKTYATKALKKKKWKHAVNVTSGVDSVAPTLESFGFTPKSIDASNGPGKVTATATLKDAASGVRSATITWTGPSGYTKASATLSRVSGSAASGTWKGTATLPCFAEQGVWKASAVVTDVAGNSRTYTAAQLAAAGYDTDLTVTMEW